MAVQLRVRVDELRALSTASFHRVSEAAGKGPFRFTFFRDVDGIAFSQLYLVSPFGTTGGTGFDMNSLPASGNDVIIYADYISGSTINLAMQAASGGSPIVDSTHGSALAALTTGSGTGALSFERSCFDSVAIFNARRTGASRFAKPEPTDADVVALYYFGEGSGTTSADAVSGGTSVALGSTTWTTGGTWDAATGGGSGLAAVLMRRRLG
jgi:hypothetical protein